MTNDESGPEPQPASQMEHLLYEVKKVVVGQDHFLERVLVALLAGGHLLVEGVPGLAKTLTVNTLAQGDAAAVPPHPVHARPGARRSGRHAHLQSEDRRVQHRARTGVRQSSARRRNQSRTRQGAERAARGDAGTPGHDRRRNPSGARPVRGHRDAEPDRDRGHLSAARGAGRPLHDEGAGRLSERRRGIRHRRARDRRRPSVLPRSPPPRSCWRRSAPRARCMSIPR